MTCAKTEKKRISRGSIPGSWSGAVPSRSLVRDSGKGRAPSSVTYAITVDAPVERAEIDRGHGGRDRRHPLTDRPPQTTEVAKATPSLPSSRLQRHVRQRLCANLNVHSLPSSAKRRNEQAAACRHVRSRLRSNPGAECDNPLYRASLGNRCGDIVPNSGPPRNERWGTVPQDGRRSNSCQLHRCQGSRSRHREHKRGHLVVPPLVIEVISCFQRCRSHNSKAGRETKTRGGFLFDESEDLDPRLGPTYLPCPLYIALAQMS